ncbi:MAG TPA: winged helix-turn-helix domain-containing protein [Solirubrobacterales bacterium]|nr:winged helix-turn-helix domain-containing protein [Solirubrobacterales bacterium]
MGATAATPDFVNPRLAAAMSHPTRIHTMCVLVERGASPREIADEIGEPLNNVTYHVNQLLKLGCIELDRTEPAGGGRVLEHFYRATRHTFFDGDGWDALAPKAKIGVINTVMRIISEDIGKAMAYGTFYARDDIHVSRSPMTLDEEGWQEVAELLKQATNEMMEIESRVADRSNDGEPPTIRTKVEILQFTSPPPDGRI